MYKEKKGTPERNKFWTKEQSLLDLRRVGNLKGVCTIYADENKGWQAYNNDIAHWRKTDERYDIEVRNILSTSLTTVAPGPGRERIDAGDKSWQDDFCRALYENDGNRKKASDVTPYSFGQIRDFLNPESTSFDKEFLTKVENTELEMAAEVEEMLMEMRKPENFSTFEKAKIAQTKAWYGLKILEKVDKKRFGKYVEMQMSGKVDHTHRLEAIPREQKIFNLYEEQRQFMEKRRLALVEGKNPDQKLDAIDAEIIEEPVESTNNNE